MQFQKEVEIRASREKVWRFIWDVDRFIACVPGCKEAKTLEEGKRYAATMVEKVGPFKVEFPTNIEVLEREEMTHIKAQASGADNKIGSRMKLDLDVNLRAACAVRAGESPYAVTNERGWHYNLPPLLAILLMPLAE